MYVHITHFWCNVFMHNNKKVLWQETCAAPCTLGRLQIHHRSDKSTDNHTHLQLLIIFRLRKENTLALNTWTDSQAQSHMFLIHHSSWDNLYSFKIQVCHWSILECTPCCVLLRAIIWKLTQYIIFVSVQVVYFIYVHNTFFFFLRLTWNR